jgi:hypothetical protein
VKRIANLISSRWFTYTLYAAGLVMAGLVTGLPRLMVLAALAFHGCLHGGISRKRLQRIGFPLAGVAFVGILVTPRPAKALFGEDLWVLLAQLAQLEQQVAQLKAMYDTAAQNYQLAQTMAQAIRNKNLYVIQSVLQAGAAAAQDHYGELAGWNQAINLGLSIPLAYRHATLKQSLNASFFSSPQLGGSYLASLAHVGISDDLSQRVMSLAAQINKQQTQNAPAIRQWQSSVSSNDPNLNTAAAQQNLANTGLVQLFEQGRSNLAVNSVIAQQLMIQNMQRRDDTVSHLNFLQDLKIQTAQAPVLGGFDAALRTHSLY